VENINLIADPARNFKVIMKDGKARIEFGERFDERTKTNGVSPV
jgi:hypothetical protein